LAPAINVLRLAIMSFAPRCARMTARSPLGGSRDK
jgi:hypothetical protein